MVAHPTVLITLDGSAIIAFPYDTAFVEQLKEEIPHRFRSWQPATKTWRVEAEYTTTAIEMLQHWFCVVHINDRRRVAPPPPPPAPRPTGAHATLFLLPTAPLAVAEAAWKALARIEHPDVTQRDNALATQRMQQLNAAITTIREQQQGATR